MPNWSPKFSLGKAESNANLAQCFFLFGWGPFSGVRGHAVRSAGHGGGPLHTTPLTDNNLFSQPPSSSQCVTKKSNSTHWEINNYPQTSYSGSGYKLLTTLLAFSPRILQLQLMIHFSYLPESTPNYNIQNCPSSPLQPASAMIHVLTLWTLRAKIMSPQLNKHSLFGDFRARQL